MWTFECIMAGLKVLSGDGEEFTVITNIRHNRFTLLHKKTHEASDRYKTAEQMAAFFNTHDFKLK